jgi:1-phosphatidylinositol-3-phosphate 5-kinase
MQNIFYGRKISTVFDLKGSLHGRCTRQGNAEKETRSSKKPKHHERSNSESTSGSQSIFGGEEDNDPIATLLDGDFLEFTSGRPLPLTEQAKNVFHMSIWNDTLFLSFSNVLDYSILVGIDEENGELVVGIVDFMRQYDMLKRMERVGKSLRMMLGSGAPTVVQPPLYKQRFRSAMEQYFVTVPREVDTL